MMESQQLAAMDLFKGLSARDVGKIAAQMRTRTVRGGQAVVSHQDESRDVYFVLAGSLRVNVLSERGRPITFRDLSTGHSFGELAALDGGQRSANVDARVDSLVGVMSAQSFLGVLQEHPSVALATLRKLTAIVRSLSAQVELLSMQVELRICHELLAMAAAVAGDGSARLRPAPRHADIASRVNTNREAVSRLYGKLQKAEVLRKGPGEVLIHVEGLRRFIHGLESEAD